MTDDVRLPGVGVLLRNEALKALRRLAFWTGVLVLALFVFLVSWGPFWDAWTGDPSTFALPEAWTATTLNLASLAGLFGATVLILLIGSEWTWKTARQNVIDGLSREQWFAGKLLLWLMLTVVFVAVPLLITGGLAAVNTELGTWPLVRVSDLVVIGGVALMVAGFLGMGFLTAFLVRSPGSAVGLFFLWVFVEQLVTGLLDVLDDWRGEVARYLPQNVLGYLGSRAQYDPELRQAQIERAVAAGRPAPEYFDLPVVVALTAGWMALFALGAYVAYRRRDL